MLKYLKISIIFLTFFKLQGQKDPIIITSFVDNTTVIKLKWQAPNLDEEEYIKIHGINVERRDVLYTEMPSSNGQNPATYQGPEPSADFLQLAMIYPYDNNFFQNHASRNTSIGNAANELLFGNAPLNFTGPALKDALKLDQSKENKSTFVSVLANRDYELTKGLGLGFQDNVPYLGVYEYRFTIGEKQILLMVDTKKESPTITPYIYGTESGDKKIAVTFDQSTLQLGLIGFYFEKSLDSLSGYQPINNDPYIFSPGKDQNGGLAIFANEVPQNGVKYYYRFRGKDYFGNYTNYSSVVSGKGIPPRLDLDIALGIDLVTESLVKFKLPILPYSYQSVINKIEIHKSKDATTGYTKVKPTQIISSSDLYFIDDQLEGSTYYILSMVDINGHYYKSNVQLIQSKDETPPAKPTGLTAVADKSGIVHLKWNNNTESDLHAYRLYRCNGINGTFIDVEDFDIKDTIYEDVLPVNQLIDSAYYKILALDYRHNYSEYSDIVGLARPDAVAPSAPVIFSGFGNAEGIYLHWEPSYSSDIFTHELQRSSATETWSTILSFTPKDSTYYTSQQNANGYFTYFDNQNIINQQYSYRLIAYDKSGNETSSNLVSITPLVTIIEGKITFIDEYHTCNQTLSSESQAKVTGISQATSTISASPNATNIKNELLQLLSNGFITVSQYQALAGQAPQGVVADLNALSNNIVTNEKKKCYINVKWRYSHKDINDDTAYEIYRAVNNYTFDIYKTVKHKDLTVINDEGTYKWTDLDVVHGRKYTYKILAINTNNTKSKVSNSVSVILQ